MVLWHGMIERFCLLHGGSAPSVGPSPARVCGCAVLASTMQWVSCRRSCNSYKLGSDQIISGLALMDQCMMTAASHTSWPSQGEQSIHLYGHMACQSSLIVSQQLPHEIFDRLALRLWHAAAKSCQQTGDPAFSSSSRSQCSE